MSRFFPPGVRLDPPPGASWRVLLVVALGAAAGLLVGPSPAAAQEEAEELRRQAEQQLGRPISEREIIQRLRQSGLSPREIRSRLEQRGYSPSTADPWLRVLEGEASQVPPGTSPMPILSVLAAEEAGRRQVGRLPPPERAERMPVDTGPPVFGRELFRRATSTFQPVTTGPVPSDYRVGPGDRLQLVITGAVEQAYTLQVSREGWIVIPDVGRVSVNGMDMEELRETLFRRLSQAYSGIERGPGATTHFDVTVAELRTNQVYVVGEVEQPAAYTVSSLATALTALYHARGPTVNGSFRRVVVNRGGQVVGEIDLYRYLVKGDASQDVRLQQGDIVFVPAAARRVRIEGPVIRPAIFQLRPGETLSDLLEYAGGVRPDAELRQVQIERILPPEQRRPGRDRAVIDVALGPAGEDGRVGEEVSLRDGDRVTVYAVREEARNQVQVSGAVWRPGRYGAGEDTRLWDVIRKAGGLLPDAHEGRAQIQRLQPDQTRRLISVSLERTAEGEPADNPRIEGMDQVILFPERNLREERVVSVGGWVRRPGVYPYSEGMTVADLVLQAGGLRTGAYLGEAQVSRVRISQSRTDTLTRTLGVALDTTLIFDGTTPRGLRQAARTLAGARDLPGAGEFPLRNLDAVYVRRAPGFEPQQTVQVTGEVQFPGPYSIRTRGEQLTDLVARAGGLTSEAYPRGFQLWRVSADADRIAREDTLSAREIAEIGAGVDTAEADEPERDREDDVADPRARRRGEQAADTLGPGLRRPPVADTLQLARAQRRTEDRYRTRVGVNFLEARESPGSSSNVLVEPGDSIHVPRFVPTVTVRGAVAVETQVLWREGAGVDYYIRQAGGYLQNADEDRTWVRYANGEVDTKGGGFLFFGGGVQDPNPGSTVTVPFEPPAQEGIRLSEFVGIFTSIASAAATVIIAVSR